MSVVLRNWARRLPVLSGYPVSTFAEARAPCDTRNVPSFLANVHGKSSAPEGAFASVSNPSHSSHLFSAQNRQFLHIGGPEDVIRLSLAYLGLLSWSVRSLARPPASRKGIRRRRDGEADDDQRILLHQFNQLEGF